MLHGISGAVAIIVIVVGMVLRSVVGGAIVAVVSALILRAF